MEELLKVVLTSLGVKSVFLIAVITAPLSVCLTNPKRYLWFRQKVDTPLGYLSVICLGLAIMGLIIGFVSKSSDNFFYSQFFFISYIFLILYGMYINLLEELAKKISSHK